jgi:tRNA-specific 2-thiouridylase
VSSTEPLFVLARRATENEVVVGRRHELEVRAVTVRELVDRGLGDGSGLRVQLRYRSPAVPVAALERLGAERALVRLGEAFAGAAPGQSAVFYRDAVVVGGGLLADPE